MSIITGHLIRKGSKMQEMATPTTRLERACRRTATGCVSKMATPTARSERVGNDIICYFDEDKRIYIERKRKPIHLPSIFQESELADRMRESGENFPIPSDCAKFFSKNIETHQQFVCFCRTIDYWGVEFLFDEFMSLNNTSLKQFLEEELEKKEFEIFPQFRAHFVVLFIYISYISRMKAPFYYSYESEYYYSCYKIINKSPDAKQIIQYICKQKIKDFDIKEFYYQAIRDNNIKLLSAIIKKNFILNNGDIKSPEMIDFLLLNGFNITMDTIDMTNMTMFKHLLLSTTASASAIKVNIRRCTVEHVEFLISINYPFDPNLDEIIKYHSYQILESLVRGTLIQITGQIHHLIISRLSSDICISSDILKIVELLFSYERINENDLFNLISVAIKHNLLDVFTYLVESGENKHKKLIGDELKFACNLTPELFHLVVSAIGVRNASIEEEEEDEEEEEMFVKHSRYRKYINSMNKKVPIIFTWQSFNNYCRNVYHCKEEYQDQMIPVKYNSKYTFYNSDIFIQLFQLCIQEDCRCDAKKNVIYTICEELNAALDYAITDIPIEDNILMRDVLRLMRDVFDYSEYSYSTKFVTIDFGSLVTNFVDNQELWLLYIKHLYRYTIEVHMSDFRLQNLIEIMKIQLLRKNTSQLHVKSLNQLQVKSLWEDMKRNLIALEPHNYFEKQLECEIVIFKRSIGIELNYELDEFARSFQYVKIFPNSKELLNTLLSKNFTNVIEYLFRFGLHFDCATCFGYVTSFETLDWLVARNIKIKSNEGVCVNIIRNNTQEIQRNITIPLLERMIEFGFRLSESCYTALYNNLTRYYSYKQYLSSFNEFEKRVLNFLKSRDVPLPLLLVGKFDEEWNEIKKDLTSYDSDY